MKNVHKMLNLAQQIVQQINKTLNNTTSKLERY
jgi:hypothetical protein